MGKIVAIIYLCVPIFLITVNVKLHRRRFTNIGMAAICFSVLYAITIISVIFREYYYDYQLRQFDLNGDGVFSGIEITPDQEKATENVTSDTGRNFAPITGFIFSLLYTFVIFSLHELFCKFRKWLNKSETST